MGDPTVSIVIHSYNHEKYISETIESILNQSFQDFEIIITYDGSSDKTIEKIKQYSDPRINLYVFKQNEEPCRAINNSINNSKGKYIVYISSDDVWEHNKLEKQVNFLYENPEFSAVFTRVKLINEDGNNLTKQDHFYHSFEQENRSRAEWLNYFFYNGNCLCHSSALIKKDVYKELGLYNERMANFSYLDMWVRLSLKLKFYILDEKLTKFRVIENEDNISDDKLTQIMGIFEYKQILNHYLIDDVEFFLKIFPDAEKFGPLKRSMIPYHLGRIAYESDHSFKKSWGLEILYNFMQSYDNVALLEKDYNFKHVDLIKMSNEIDSNNLFLNEKDVLIGNMDHNSLEKDKAIKKMEITIRGLIYDKDNLIKQKNKLLNLRDVELKEHDKDNLIKQKNKLLNLRDVELKEHDKEMENLKSNLCEFEYKTKKRTLSKQIYFKFPILDIIFNKFNTSYKNILVNIRGYRAIKKQDLFDVGYYLNDNKDVKDAGKNPIIHYFYHGYKEINRNPSPNFDGNKYLKEYPDVKDLKMNPLIHYSLFGMKEKRKIIPVDKRLPKTIHKVLFDELNKSEKKETLESILKKNASIVDLYPFQDDDPLISIIILNRNGLEHLKRLFKNFKENSKYPAHEIIVVDNGSTDESIDYLEVLQSNLPIKIIKNSKNKSFSEANNDAVNIAKGEYILLLNNDVEPTLGWLNEMMQTSLRYDKVGAVGAKLVYPPKSDSSNMKNNSFKIQHAGIGFKLKPNQEIEPIHACKGLNAFDVYSNVEQERAGVTGAVLLVKKGIYQEVGGLDENYHYGYEDVDFCLKLLKKGYSNIYCPKALLFHYEFGTREDNEIEYLVDKHIKNEKVLFDKWYNWLYERIEDKMIFLSDS